MPGFNLQLDTVSHPSEGTHDNAPKDLTGGDSYAKNELRFRWPYPGATPTVGDREYIDWLLTFKGIGLVPLEGKGPKKCRVPSHVECAPFNHGYYSATRNAKRMVAVLKRHPEKRIGVVPGDGVAVVDFDSEEEIRYFADATGVDLNDHLVVGTKRGLHLYLALDPATRYSLGKVPDVDLRYQGVGVVVAPGEGLVDNEGEYQILSGSWGNPQSAPSALAYFPPSKNTIGTESERAERGDLGTIASPIARRHYVLRRINELEKSLTYKAKSSRGRRTTPSKNQKVDQSDLLCSTWLHCYWSGMAVGEAVNFVISRSPKIVSRRLSSRSKSWIRKDAERVYRKASAPKFQAPQAKRTLAETFKENHRLVQVLDYILNKINLTDSAEVAVGCQELADRFDVSKQAAARWLLRLIDLDVITKTRKAVWRNIDLAKNKAEAKRQCRVAEYTVAGLSPISRESVQPSSNETASAPSDRDFTERPEGRRFRLDAGRLGEQGAQHHDHHAVPHNDEVRKSVKMSKPLDHSPGQKNSISQRTMYRTVRDQVLGIFGVEPRPGDREISRHQVDSH